MMIGKEILGYRVDEEVGSGGFGTVYKVSKTNAAGTYVRALKHITLPSEKQYNAILNSMGGDYAKADDYFSNVLKDIVEEIKILSTLSESGIKNIVRYYENDIIENTSPLSYDIYILMEFLTPFPDYLISRKFTVKDVIQLGKDILSALISCHGKNIIHRDIKDDNIFVSQDGVYKLGDFGVSKSLKDKSHAESIKGTPNFIAPEVYLGKEKYDCTVDVYSLGIVLYSLLNKSRNPFLPDFPAQYTTTDESAAFEERISGKIPKLPICANNKLGEAVVKAIMPRNQRYNSAAEFLSALQSAESLLSNEELSTVVNIVREQNDSRGATRSSSPTVTVTVGGYNNPQKDNNIQVKEQNKPTTPDKDLGLTISDSIKTSTVEKNNENPDANLFITMSSTANAQAQNINGSSAISNSTPTADNSAKGNGNQTKKQEFNQRNFKTKDGQMIDGKKPPKVSAVPLSLIYLCPFIIFAVYIVVYFIVLPKIILKTSIGIIDWMFTDPKKILELLKDPDTFLNPLFLIIGSKILGWILLTAFVASVIFAVHKSQDKKKADKINPNAILLNREAKIRATALYEKVKSISGQDVTAAKNALYKVQDRISTHSDFGSGSDTVINCENEIAQSFNEIEKNIPALQDERTNKQATQNIQQECDKIISNLAIRTELRRQ